MTQNNETKPKSLPFVSTMGGIFYMKELNAHLDEVKEELRFYKKWTSRQEQLWNEIDEAKSKMDRFKNQLDKENRDVENPEGWTITGLLLLMMGKKEERLHRES
jgi:hypothetical protein